MAVRVADDEIAHTPTKKGRLGMMVDRFQQKVTKSKSKRNSKNKTKSKKQSKKKSQGRVWDPEKSYVETITPPKFEPKGPRMRWQVTGEPILDPSKIPEGWNDEEPDLDPE
ncbi:hypothetical protein N7478_005222 [Penicillium angulare]|uniref:uncharacterized protein n=1 Tax=Penicillium angulare TaxID=116970 RepID=UPI00254018AE|nr:uncharacterized protein N7478_005222 [Penicillium angulare]KAJ5279850.1 hypothetical protein N7478_005222 [Penicillium angulare]